MNVSPDYNAAIASEKDPQVAFEATEDERNAIPKDQVLTVNVDGPQFAGMALGARRNITVLLEQLSELPDFDVRAPHQLEERALAFLHAHTVHLSATRLPDSLSAMLEEGVAQRNRFRPVCKALVARGLLDERAFSACRWQSGFVNVAQDVQILSSVLLDNWKRVGHKCPIERSELERARKLATLMIRQSGERNAEQPATAETADARDRAFTLLVRCYDEVRRGVNYLRYPEGDAERFAPSLYKGRRRTGKKDDPAPEQPNPTQPLNNGAPIPGGSPFIR